MTKLTDTQLVLLNGAAQRDDHGIAAIDKRAATREAIEGLLKAKLLKTVGRTPELALWTRGDDNQPLALIVTAKGLKAINMESAAAEPGVDVEAPAAKPKRKTSAKVGALPDPSTSKPSRRSADTKLGAIVKLMQRAKGATLADMMSATGWQTHSVRGAIAGAIKKKLGHSVSAEKVGDARTYRIAGLRRRCARPPSLPRAWLMSPRGATPAAAV